MLQNEANLPSEWSNIVLDITGLKYPPSVCQMN